MEIIHHFFQKIRETLLFIYVGTPSSQLRKLANLFQQKLRWKTGKP